MCGPRFVTNSAAIANLYWEEKAETNLSFCPELSALSIQCLQGHLHRIIVSLFNPQAMDNYMDSWKGGVLQMTDLDTAEVSDSY